MMERSAATVDTVDIRNRIVHMFDKTGGKFQASYMTTDSTFQIPMPGETWSILRWGHIWHLEKRFDGPGETVKSTLSLGDVHIRTPGNVYMDSDTLNLGQGIISPTTRDTTRIGGTQSTFTLSGTPVHPYTVMVYKNGALLHPDIDWTIIGNIITFTANLVSNDKLTVYYQRIGAEYRDAATVTTIADMTPSLDNPYKDAGTETAMAIISAWEAR